MSTFTQNLQLTMPELTDEQHQTILELADNFRILDEASEKAADTIPVNGMYKKGHRIWNTDLKIGGYAGWINLRFGEAAPAWQSFRRYRAGDLVVPAADNGHYYKCIHPGTSGVHEPTFPTTAKGTVDDIKNSTTWAPAKNYVHYDIVVPKVPNGYFFVCTIAGLSFNFEPNWIASEGAATVDNNVTWIAYPIATWEEQGTPCQFRPFGKIE
ncbi:hypothetical protein ACFVVQ_17155 [Paenibacillus chitinolyticus]|uniref:hypothetical protein n=1 Tax=Paenibacillus TaxID=44249 RepID=UPI001C475EE8|nr:hypothetical protein [Paenibacillus chitinolyticus]MBV6713971.1 hypothetical protein [Paenibacillus chitinolyticus]